MQNSIDNVSFGAHLTLQNNSLYKHVSRDVANKVAAGTRSIPGTMTIKKSTQNGLDIVLNKNEFQALCIGAPMFYGMKDAEKVSYLKRAAKYINELVKIDNLMDTKELSKSETEACIKRLSKIVGNDENLAWVFQIHKDSLLDKVV